MDKNLKHKLGTTIAIERNKVLDYFDRYIIDEFDDSEKESFICKDGSLLVLKQSETKEQVFVQFHLNLQINAPENSISFQGKIWFMEFCKKHNSEIKNLRTGVTMPISDGAIMSDIFTSEAFRIAKHQAHHPNDKKRTANKT